MFILATVDCSARVWHSGGRDISTGDQWVLPVKVGPVLYGHGARLWDCYVSEKVRTLIVGVMLCVSMRIQL